MANGKLTTTPPVRISYPYLFQPRFYGNQPRPGETPRFGCTILLPKNDPAIKAYLNGLFNDIQALITEVWPNPAERPRAPIVGGEGCPIKNADETIGKDHVPVIEKNPEYAGHWYINLSNVDQPQLFDINGQKIIHNQNQIYAGCWCLVSLHPYTWSNANGKGISFQVNGVLFNRDDKPFSNRVAPTYEQMFPGTPVNPQAAQNPANYAPQPGQVQGQAPNPYPPQDQGFGTQPGQNMGNPAPQPTQPAYQPPIDPATGQPYQNAPNPAQNPVNYAPNPAGQPQQPVNPTPGQNGDLPPF